MRDSGGLNKWVIRLSDSELPVLSRTAHDLAELHGHETSMNANDISGIIARDPMMTVKLLRYLQRHKHKAQTTEVIQVEQALLMLGIDSFVDNVALHPIAEDMLNSNELSLTHMLSVIHRSHRASEYAKDWAVQLRDLHFEEVRVAALLHDIAEILMWCFAPGLMLEIFDLQQEDKSMRSRSAQEQVLGFSLIDLLKELAIQWNLPSLLLTLMDDSKAQHTRVRNVILAVNLARHSADGWNDSALPNDYNDISELLRIPVAQVISMVATDACLPCDPGRLHPGNLHIS